MWREEVALKTQSQPTLTTPHFFHVDHQQRQTKKWRHSPAPPLLLNSRLDPLGPMNPLAPSHTLHMPPPVQGPPSPLLQGRLPPFCLPVPEVSLWQVVLSQEHRKGLHKLLWDSWERSVWVIGRKVIDNLASLCSTMIRRWLLAPLAIFCRLAEPKIIGKYVVAWFWVANTFRMIAITDNFYAQWSLLQSYLLQECFWISITKESRH